jgi:prepilin signal peptidase PulO-like enzyme (type II secretory pathway)
MPADAKGFFRKLFDVQFRGYVTPTIVSVLYVLGMVGIGFAYLFYVVLAFNAEPVLGLLVLLIIGPLMSLLLVIWLRVTLEFYLALVRLSDDFRQWREEWLRQQAS